MINHSVKIKSKNKTKSKSKSILKSKNKSILKSKNKSILKSKSKVLLYKKLYNEVNKLEEDKKKIDSKIMKHEKMKLLKVVWILPHSDESYLKVRNIVLQNIEKLGFYVSFYKKYLEEDEIKAHIENMKRSKKSGINSKSKIEIKNKIYNDFNKAILKEEEEINYYSLYPKYKELQNTVKELLTKDIHTQNKYLLQNEYLSYKDTSFYVKKDTYIYKGVKYFYSKKDELPFFKKIKYGYYGDKYIALKYAERYSGGLQVYKAKKELKFFNVTNDKNIQYILSLINENSTKKFFKNITYKYFAHCIKMKYGVNINKYEQAYLLTLYLNYYPELWLSKMEDKDYLPITDYTGWYFGHGFIDRICVEGIMNLIGNEYDGATSIAGYYTPYMGQTQNEVIIWNQYENLERIENDELDSMTFRKTLPFDTSKIVLNEDIASFNKNFKFNLFYHNHFFTNKKIFDVPKKNNSNHLKILSLNVNNFVSIHLLDHFSNITKSLLQMLKLYDVDICFLQEYYKSDKIIDKEYHIIQNVKHNGLVVLYKKTIELKNIYSIKLHYDKELKNHQFALFFEYNNRKFSLTQLENGKRFTNRDYTIVLPNEFIEIANFNSNLRIQQLEDILKENPDVIVGSMNFNKYDKELLFMLKHKYYTNFVDYTSVHGTQVDFIFSKKEYSFIKTINFAFSEHLPLFAIV